MPAAPVLVHEADRLRALHDYDVLDTPPEASFDELVALAAQICEAPISLVSFIDRDRQWFKARYGLTASETPRSVSFCAHAIAPLKKLLIVPDATRDSRFADNPLVTGEAGIRFYAGVPLRTPEGEAIGTLCVLDRRPRNLGPKQQEALLVLGRQAMAQLELRRRLNESVLNKARLENSQRIAGLGDWDYDFSAIACSGPKKCIGSSGSRLVSRLLTPKPSIGACTRMISRAFTARKRRPRKGLAALISSIASSDPMGKCGTFIKPPK